VHVPSGNGWLYLARLTRRWDAGFAPGDWTLDGTDPGHTLFNLVFGWLALVLPLETVAWVGRFGAWTACFAGLLRLGRSFGLPLWMATLSIVLWCACGQSLVGEEWVIGSFEGKVVAWALLFFALDGFARGRTTLPAILLGLSFSLHPLVGLWGGLAIGVTAGACGWAPARMLRTGALVLVFSLPGLLPFALAQSTIASTEFWRWRVLVHIPFHIDPASFVRRGMLTLFVLFLFNQLAYWRRGGSEAVRFLVVFQAALAFFFLVGVAARAFEAWHFLNVMPFRHFPLIVPLFFWFQLFALLRSARETPPTPLLVTLGVLALLCLPNPVAMLYDHAHQMWDRTADIDAEDLGAALDWIATGTPADAKVILPPWRSDSYLRSRRAQIATYRLMRPDRSDEWRWRTEILAGPFRTSARLDGDRGMIERYNARSTETLSIIGDAFGAGYLVSAGRHPFEVLYEKGRWRIYALPESS
jgi:hypothetical protein